MPDMETAVERDRVNYGDEGLMLEAVGNLWTYRPADALVITTNGEVTPAGRCVMGRGVAQQARDTFRGLDKKLGGYIEAYGPRCFNLGRYRLHDRRVHLVSFPVKRHWKDAADLDLIRDSAVELLLLADKFGWRNVVLPRPGCGNGRRQWSEVKPQLMYLLDHRFIIVHPGEAMTRFEYVAPEHFQQAYDTCMEEAARCKIVLDAVAEGHTIITGEKGETVYFTSATRRATPFDEAEVPQRSPT